MFGFWTTSCRFYHSTKALFGTNSSLLGKLRKSTGFPISNCKKALENFPGDVQKAEEWLQSEAKKMGWSKWNKIQNRRAVQGLVGVYTEDSFGVMVEVNCETDFVAKNVEFQNLIGSVLLGCVENTEQLRMSPDKKFQKHLLTEVDLMNLNCKSFNMQELLNSAVSKFNEKTVFKRAVVLKINRELSVNIAGLSHPTEQCPNFHQVCIGKFGALIAYQSKSDLEDREFGTNMCQHVIGMNPSSIGAEDFVRLSELGKLNIESGLPQDELRKLDEPGKLNEEDNEETFQSDLKDTDECRLLFQPYLLDPNMRVYNYVKNNADILDFERFECGESE